MITRTSIIRILYSIENVLTQKTTDFRMLVGHPHRWASHLFAAFPLVGLLGAPLVEDPASRNKLAVRSTHIAPPLD